MNSMTQDETYNGYANRETWAFNLHWQNDQGLYNETLEVARQYLSDTYNSEPLDADELKAAEFGVGEFVVDYWSNFISEYADNFGSEPSEGLKMFEREVGSWWRINYAEIGQAVREALDNE